MMKKTITLSIVLLLTVFVYGQKKEKTYKVLAACGQCQFNMTGKPGCELAIQLGGKNYWVNGSKLSDHGDQHANDGLCRMSKKAVVIGRIEGDEISVSSVEFLAEKKKKKK